MSARGGEHGGKHSDQGRLFRKRNDQGVELDVGEGHASMHGLDVTAFVLAGSAGAGADLVNQVLPQRSHSLRAGHGLSEEFVDAAVRHHDAEELIDYGGDGGEAAQIGEERGHTGGLNCDGCDLVRVPMVTD